jgi:uncharacterized protein (TIGR03067 family)
MRLFSAASLIIVWCLSPTLADDPTKGDLAKVQGKWKGMVGREKNIPLVIEVKGNAATLTATRPEGDDFVLNGEVKLDDQAKPKKWDWMKFTGPGGQEAPDNLGIYELEGDTLKICNGGPGNERPTEFKAGENGPPNLLTLTRVKEESKDK